MVCRNCARAGLAWSLAGLLLMGAGCQDATNLAGNENPPADDTQYLTLDDEAIANMRIVAERSADAERAWNLSVGPADLLPGAQTLRFVWDFGDALGSAEGATQAVTFPDDGDYHITVHAYTPAGVYLFSLTLDLKVAPGGPVANAGADVDAAGGERVCLDGSASVFPEGMTPAYAWQQIGGTAVQMAEAIGGAELCFEAPMVDADEALVFTLQVGDGASEDTVVVHLAGSPATAGLVVADAGPDQAVTAGDTVELDGRGSTVDSDARVAYRWTQTAGPQVQINGASLVVASFKAPDVADVTALEFRLSLTSGSAVGLDDMTVTVSPADDGSGDLPGGGGGPGGGGTPTDNCPDDPEKTEPGVCGCGIADTDTDDDGTPDCIDACPNDAGKVSPGLCGCGLAESDDDDDGTPNCNDGCPFDPEKTSAGACGCGVADYDADGDGVADCDDPCATSPDSDGDGTPDCADACPNDPAKTAPGACGCGVSDADADGDGAPNCSDGCPHDPAKTAPGACGCGVSDADADGDGVPNCSDACPNDPAKTAAGVCGCGVADVDADTDGVPDCHDDCTGGPDSDGDGVVDCDESCPQDPAKTAPGACGCGVSDADGDGDGTANCLDGCPTDPAKTSPGACGCGVADTDGDHDGTPDCHDGCPADPAKTVPGACGCGVADTDANHNGTADCNDPPAQGYGPETFVGAACGADPAGWSDTAANNATSAADDFAVQCLGSEHVFGTTSAATNVHSHYTGTGSGAWSTYSYTGRMMIASSSGGIGVTVLSDYPNSDAYYRLRRGPFSGGYAFHVDAHPDSNQHLQGTTTTTVTPAANAWYRFRFDVVVGATRTELRARLWTDGSAEPSTWNIDCYDESATRRTAGTVGIWSMGSGGKYWDDLAVSVSGCDDDSDGDGTVDCADPCANDPAKVLPGVCGCGVPDVDTDHDNLIDCQDPCVGGADSDGDGTVDCAEECPNDPNKTTPGVCGCGVSDNDSDGEGVADCLDRCAGAPDSDSDGDGVADCVDACPGFDDHADADGDGTPDGCDDPHLAVSPAALSLSGTQTQASFEVWNAGGSLLAYTVSENASWLTLAPAGGTSAGEHDVITLNVNRSGLADGTYTTDVTVSAAGINTQVVHVTLLVQSYTGPVLTPMARWDVVPQQRIDAGETLKAGVVAFSKNGIQEVRFNISGQGYSGQNPKVATAMTYNDRTDVWEYWVPIAASEFASDGLITVEATVIGADGGVRDKNTTPGNGLEALKLNVNPSGTLAHNLVWVDASSGNDGNGAVNNASRPFKTIGKAMKALETYQGGKADGAEVRLRPGNHVMDGNANWGVPNCNVVNEWITITHDPDAGGTAANTRITGVTNGSLWAYWLKVQGVSLTAPDIISGGSGVASLWLKDCVMPGGSGSSPFPVAASWTGPHYYTECTISNMRRATGYGQGQKIMRNLTINAVREDCFQNVPFGVNIRVFGSDPGAVANPEHADVIQGWGAAPHNWIWYNVVAKDLHYQGIFIRSGDTAKNNAFVNCLLEMRDPIRNDPGDGRGSDWAGKFDHLILWNCTFMGTPSRNNVALGIYESATSPPNQFLMKNVSVRGCMFTDFRSYVSTEDKAWVNNADVDIRDNHYINLNPPYHGMAPDSGDSTITMGDAKIERNVGSPDLGRPLAGSPLLNRISPPLVPADAFGEAHGASSPVGALAP